MKILKKMKKKISIFVCIIFCLTIGLSYLDTHSTALGSSSKATEALLNVPLKFYRKVTNIISPTESVRIKNASKTLYQEVYSALIYNDDFYEKGIVKRVVDGDTLVVLVNGLEEKIRLIGVNTPESVGKYAGKPQFYGKEASNYTKRQLLGKHIYLEADRGPTDKYGRNLRYVWLKKPDEAVLKDDLFNAILLSKGYGNVMIIAPNDKYKDIFYTLEGIAKLNKLGVWSK